jgi:hypothetical protein
MLFFQTHQSVATAVHELADPTSSGCADPLLQYVSLSAAADVTSSRRAYSALTTRCADGLRSPASST